MLSTFFLLLFALVLGTLVVLLSWAVWSFWRHGAPFIPTDGPIADALLTHAQLQPTDRCVDLGCGHGAITLRAARQCADAVGVDIYWPVIAWARARARWWGVPARFIHGDLFMHDWRDRTVIFCYLFPGLMHRIANEIWPTLHPGTRLISHGFPLGSVPPTATHRHGRAIIFVYVR